MENTYMLENNDSIIVDNGHQVVETAENNNTIRYDENRELTAVSVNQVKEFADEENKPIDDFRINGSHLISQPAVHFGSVPSELVDLMVKEIENMPVVEFPNADVGSEEDPIHDLQIRNSKLNWWYEDHWACSIMSHYINIANRSSWEYDLNFLSGLQISTYESNGHYTWHSDYGTSNDQRYTRKLSASLLVSDPSEYEGGDFEYIDYHNNPVVSPREKGTIIVFDSRIPHRVTPVTKGKRVSIVAWMLGPKLK